MRVLAFFTTLAAVSFVLHYIWEGAHVHLYTNYDGLSGALPITLWATLGDVFYSLFVGGALAAIRKGVGGVEHMKSAEYAWVALVGLALAISIELRAQWLQLWSYTEAMLIIPVLNIGLSPVLQMTLLLPLSIFFTTLLLRVLFPHAKRA